MCRKSPLGMFLVVSSVLLAAVPATHARYSETESEYSGGSGTPDDPYQLATAEDLLSLGDTPEHYDKNFVLTGDIDLRDFGWVRAIIAPDVNNVEDGYQGVPFSGYFDGGGHIIHNLTIWGDDYVALFGFVDPNATIQSLGLENVAVYGSGTCVGGLVGYLHEGRVSLSFSTGYVRGDERVGGLVGHVVAGDISSSYSSGSVIGDKEVGGFAGFNNRGNIVDCHSGGLVIGSEYVGGLVGGDFMGTITSCGAESSVFGNLDIGGLVGSLGGTVMFSYSNGQVSGEHWVGGLTGSSYDGLTRSCYSTCAVYGLTYVGGLVGMIDSTAGSITCSYSAGSVSGKGYWFETGGLVGGNMNHSGTGADVTQSFWDTEASGQAMSVGGTGKPTAEMQDPNTFMAEGWDFVSQPDGPHDIWAVPEDGGYPILWWQLSPLPELPTFSGGAGEPNDPYLISTAQELNSIGHNPRLMRCHFRLTEDLDLGGIKFYPIGGPVIPYEGLFEGDDHTVSHLAMTGGSYLGLFGNLGSQGTVRALGVLDVNIMGDSYVGGLIGSNSGNLEGGVSTGSVTGDDYVGGLIGQNWGKLDRSYSTACVTGDAVVGGLVGNNRLGYVATSYSTGSVAGDWYVGGLVGDNSNGAISTSYSICSVAGNRRVGGLVGGNSSVAGTSGRIATSYSAGFVIGSNQVGGFVGTYSWDISTCFWDIETSGQATSPGDAIGLMTEQMHTASTYLDAGWDFIDETENGTDDIWWIDEGQDYPHLWWESGH